MRFDDSIFRRRLFYIELNLLFTYYIMIKLYLYLFIFSNYFFLLIKLKYTSGNNKAYFSENFVY